VKAGKWWQNTIIYFILRIIFKWLKAIVQEICELIRAVPLVWKTVAITITALILMGILCFNGLYHDELMVAYICACFILLAAIVYAASQLNKLKIAGEKLSSGDFDYKTDTSRMHFDFKRHAENLNSIGDGMARAVEQRIRSERLKTELITNVSHDIKTPLTNIVNYVDLLRRSPTPEEQEQYLEVLSRQAERLKKLTVDLVEASKASTGNIAVELVPTNAEEIINQAVAEYSEKFAAGKLEPIITLPPEPVTILADGRHLWRVLDNLFNNAVKYAQPGTRLYVDVVSSGGEAVISVKNISRERLNVSSDELMERFVRGDSSRHTEGSGLGLSIARSLTELMGGSFNISIDGDLFKAMICLKKAE
jgi:signal transduction histidine kinase